MRLLPFLAIPIAALTLTACSTTPATPEPVNTASEETSTFATDEEALAAAEAAYAEYLQVSDQIARDGGVNPERLKEYLSGSQYELELEQMNTMKKQGLTMAGETNFDTLHLQSRSNTNTVVYLCLDSSKLSAVRPDGSTNAPADARWPLQVTFVTDSQGKIKISGSETWTGENFC